jgi:hypothetical protein
MIAARSGEMARVAALRRLSWWQQTPRFASPLVWAVRLRPAFWPDDALRHNLCVTKGHHAADRAVHQRLSTNIWQVRVRSGGSPREDRSPIASFENRLGAIDQDQFNALIKVSK